MASRSYLIYGVSIAVHIGIAVWAGVIHHRKRVETVALEYAETKKREEQQQKKPLPPPKEQKKRAVARRTRAPSAPPPEAQPATAATNLDALPDFGLALSGGVEGDGVLVPAARGPALAAPAAIVKRVVKTPVARSNGDGCGEAITKAKPKRVPQLSYTAEARAASVQGKLRVQLSISETGEVIGVKVLQGLGYGLDEAALSAARQATFEPATRCGRPIASTFVIAMRFAI
jgi:periplasmic protein TonB